MKKIATVILVGMLIAVSLTNSSPAKADAGYPYVADARYRVLDNKQVLIYSIIDGILYGRSGVVRVCAYPVSGITTANIGMYAYSADAPIVVFKTGTQVWTNYYTGNWSQLTTASYACVYQRFERTAGSLIPRTVQMDADNNCQPACNNDNPFKMTDTREVLGDPNAYTACVILGFRAQDDAYPADAAPETRIGTTQYPVCW